MPRKKAVTITISSKKTIRKASPRSRTTKSVAAKKTSKLTTKTSKSTKSSKQSPARKPITNGTLKINTVDPRQFSRHRIFYIIMIAVTLGISGMLIMYSFSVARAQHRQQHTDFNIETMKLEPALPLTASFIETAEEQEFTFAFSLTNSTEHTYTTTFSGEVSGNPSTLALTPPVELKPGMSKMVEITLPLSYNEGLPANLTLGLKTEIATNHLLGSLVKEIEKQFPVTLKLATDEEIVNAQISTGNKEITHGAEDFPNLDMTVMLTNKTSRAFSDGSYEIFLTDKDKKRVQPLLVEAYSLNPSESKTFKHSFKFTLPPANQIDPGSQDYYLEINYSARTGTRTFTHKSYSPTTVKINVSS